MIRNPLFKILRVLFIYYICAIIGSFAATFFLKPPIEVLPLFSSSYMISRAFLYFAKILMAVQSSAIIMSFAWFLKDYFSDTNQLTYAIRTKIFQAVFIVLIFTTALYTLITEIAEPSLRTSIQNAEENTVDYYTYVDYAQSFIDWNNYDEARPYVKQALTIYPASQEALQMERIVDTAPENEVQEFSSVMNVDEDVIEQDQNFADLLDKARTAYENGSYIDAHYYATLALRSPNTHSIQEARLIAADAWNKVADSTDFDLGEDADVYARKRLGYEYILQDNSLAAYYVFNDLIQRFPHDPDVVRYFDIASKKLHSEHFFIDEVYNARAYETLRNVNFINKLPNGYTDLVFISGLSTMHDSYGLVQYARDVHIIRLDAENNYLYSMTVDYAKISSVVASNFGTEFIPYFDDVNSSSSTVPFVQLVSVDRNQEGIILFPKYENVPENFDALSTYIFYMPYEDFELLSDVSRGPRDMALSSVYKFAGMAEKYGYSFEVFYQILAIRLTFPLIVLIINLSFVVLAWRYRLMASAVIKFWWLFLMPLCTLICYVFIEVVLYFFKLLLFTFIGFFKWYAIIGFCIALVIMFAIIAIIFAVQKYE